MEWTTTIRAFLEPAALSPNAGRLTAGGYAKGSKMGSDAGRVPCLVALACKVSVFDCERLTTHVVVVDCGPS